MFFVSMLLNQILGWMRTQPGTGSLRALVYMDEIFGYFPPVQNPPSKLPLLTLLKQARAFGVGIVLATQNPVDLDYKGLSNAGTWFVGRLQAERDKARLMDGLEGATSTVGTKFDKTEMDRIISGLGSRIFLMNNAKNNEPIIFQTRWSMSYLRGPLTRSQIKALMDPVRRGVTAQPQRVPAADPFAPQVPKPEASAATVSSGRQPTLPPEVEQYFAPVRGSAAAGQTLTYQAMLLGAAKVRFLNIKSNVDAAQNVMNATPISDQAVAVNWDESLPDQFPLQDLEKSPARGAQFAELNPDATKPRNYLGWGRNYANWLYGRQKISLLCSPGTGQVSNVGESERDFRVRLQQSFREQRDEATETLRQKYAAKLLAAQEKIRRAQEAIDREQAQAKSVGMQTAISIGATILGAFLGGGRKIGSRTNIGHAASSAKSVARTMQQAQDVARAKSELAAFEQQLKDLEERFHQEAAELRSRIDPQNEVFESIIVRPKKADISIQLVALLWLPYWQDSLGNINKAW